MSLPTTETPSGFPIHHSIPYTSPTTSLQALDLWLPRLLDASNPASTIFLVYVHGGAWRDPLQDSSCVLPTLRQLSSHPDALSSIAGVASINYRLSPYPSHPSKPSSPDDSSRNVRHPTHIQDVESAIKYLGRKFGIGARRENGNEEVTAGGYKWIGIGHSCGATLLCQFVSRIGTSSTTSQVSGPSALILLEGIYNIPLFLEMHSPSRVPSSIARIYRDIVTGAFGSKEEAWVDASPVSGRYLEKDWNEGILVVLAHSPEDELVEVEQRDCMLKRLEDCEWKNGSAITSDDSKGLARTVVVKNLQGQHDSIWEDGRQIASLIADVVKRILES
jgi:kynurenine formamidase